MHCRILNNAGDLASLQCCVKSLNSKHFRFAPTKEFKLYKFVKSRRKYYSCEECEMKISRDSIMFFRLKLICNGLYKYEKRIEPVKQSSSTLWRNCKKYYISPARMNRRSIENTQPAQIWEILIELEQSAIILIGWIVSQSYRRVIIE